jgi:hypothetical protein
LGLLRRHIQCLRQCVAKSIAPSSGTYLKHRATIGCFFYACAIEHFHPACAFIQAGAVGRSSRYSSLCHQMLIALLMPAPFGPSIQPAPLSVNQSSCCCAVVRCLKHLVIMLLCAS